MTRLTKDQIQKLSPEQQLVVGELELRRIKKFEEYLRKARGSRFHIPLGTLVFAILPFILLATSSNIEDRILTLFMFCFIVIFILFQVGCLARRQDALIELILKNIENPQSIEKN